jgi:putative membrane protein
MSDYSFFPALNASLNGVSAVLIVTGHSLIRQGKVQLHRACMLSAVIVSSAFLACYLYYHAHVGSVHFPGQGWARPVYFSILISHTILAAAVPVLVVLTLVFAFRQKFERHRKIARWTYPIWLYVSVTGVIVYLMLYQIYGSRG